MAENSPLTTLPALSCWIDIDKLITAMAWARRYMAEDTCLEQNCFFEFWSISAEALAASANKEVTKVRAVLYRRYRSNNAY